MQLANQPPMGGSDLVGGRALGDLQDVVIVSLAHVVCITDLPVQESIREKLDIPREEKPFPFEKTDIDQGGFEALP